MPRPNRRRKPTHQTPRSPKRRHRQARVRPRPRPGSPSPIPLPVLREATEVIGCSFLQSYGLTESTGGFTLLGPAGHVPDEKFAHRLRSAGRPMVGARVRVADPVTLTDRPVGERGEVLVAGSRIMKGYWRKPGQTAQVMLPGG